MIEVKNDKNTGLLKYVIVILGKKNLKKRKYIRNKKANNLVYEEVKNGKIRKILEVHHLLQPIL